MCNSVISCKALLWGGAVMVGIGCREVGGDCDFVAVGESKEEILYCLMRHVEEIHTDDWFSVEEIYASACALIQQRVA